MFVPFANRKRTYMYCAYLLIFFEVSQQQNGRRPVTWSRPEQSNKCHVTITELHVAAVAPVLVRKSLSQSSPPIFQLRSSATSPLISPRTPAPYHMYPHQLSYACSPTIHACIHYLNVFHFLSPTHTFLLLPTSPTFPTFLPLPLRSVILLLLNSLNLPIRISLHPSLPPKPFRSHILHIHLLLYPYPFVSNSRSPGPFLTLSIHTCNFYLKLFVAALNGKCEKSQCCALEIEEIIRPIVKNLIWRARAKIWWIFTW